MSQLNCIRAEVKSPMEVNISVLLSIQRKDWMVTMDMRDAYFHFQINQESHTVLRFVLNYQFRALGFGLTAALQVLTRV